MLGKSTKNTFLRFWNEHVKRQNDAPYMPNTICTMGRVCLQNNYGQNKRSLWVSAKNGPRQFFRLKNQKWVYEV